MAIKIISCRLLLINIKTGSIHKAWMRKLGRKYYIENSDKEWFHDNFGYDSDLYLFACHWDDLIDDGEKIFLVIPCYYYKSHKAVIITLHSLLFPASCLISSSKLLLQIPLGRPRRLEPCRFYLSACLVVHLASFRRVCPVQAHLLQGIWMSIGYSWYIWSRLWLLMITKLVIYV